MTKKSELVGRIARTVYTERKLHKGEESLKKTIRGQVFVIHERLRRTELSLRPCRGKTKVEWIL